MIKKINGALPGNVSRSITKVGITTVENITWYESDINVTGINQRLEPDIGFFTTTGRPTIGVAGALLFNCEAGFGALAEGGITNYGSTGVYVGFNSVTPVVASGTYLHPGNTLEFSTIPVRQLWAITASGTAEISAWGNFNRNSNTV